MVSKSEDGKLVLSEDSAGGEPPFYRVVYDGTYVSEEVSSDGKNFVESDYKNDEVSFELQVPLQREIQRMIGVPPEKIGFSIDTNDYRCEICGNKFFSVECEHIKDDYRV